MKPLLSFATAAALFAVALPACALDSAAYDRCMNAGAAAKGNMGAMLVCAQQEYARQDRDLNREYQQLMKQLDPSAAAQLRTAQRAWITFRDSEAASYLTDGHESALNVAVAKAELTQQRAMQLLQRSNDLMAR